MALLHVHQFYLGNVTTVNPVKTTAYTVPSGDRVVIRSIAVRNLAPSANMTWYVYLNSTLVFTNVLGFGGTSAGSFEWRPWLVLDPADVLYLTVAASAGIGAIVSGSLYTI